MGKFFFVLVVELYKMEITGPRGTKELRRGTTKRNESTVLPTCYVAISNTVLMTAFSSASVIISVMATIAVPPSCHVCYPSMVSPVDRGHIDQIFQNLNISDLTH